MFKQDPCGWSIEKKLKRGKGNGSEISWEITAVVQVKDYGNLNLAGSYGSHGGIVPKMGGASVKGEG